MFFCSRRRDSINPLSCLHFCCLFFLHLCFHLSRLISSPDTPPLAANAGWAGRSVSVNETERFESLKVFCLEKKWEKNRKPASWKHNTCRARKINSTYVQVACFAKLAWERIWEASPLSFFCFVFVRKAFASVWFTSPPLALKKKTDLKYFTHSFAI